MSELKLKYWTDGGIGRLESHWAGCEEWETQVHTAMHWTLEPEWTAPVINNYVSWVPHLQGKIRQWLEDRMLIL